MRDSPEEGSEKCGIEEMNDEGDEMVEEKKESEKFANKWRYWIPQSDLKVLNFQLDVLSRIREASQLTRRGGIATPK